MLVSVRAAMKVVSPMNLLFFGSSILSKRAFGAAFLERGVALYGLLGTGHASERTSKGDARIEPRMGGGYLMNEHEIYSRAGSLSIARI